MNLTLISLILSSLLTANLQGPSKLVKVVHWKDEPVEFVSVKLRGRTLNPGNSLDAYPDWNKELEITVKNVSEKPITFVSVELSTSNESDTEAVATTLYTFGSMPGGDGPVRYLKPSETTLLTHQWTTGDPLDPRPVEISFRVVFWNNDKSVQWRAGRLLQLVDPDTGRYVPKPKSGARYQYPKGYHASPQFVKAAMQTIPFCDQLDVGTVNKLCNAASKNCLNQTCYVQDLQSQTCSWTGPCDTKVRVTSPPCSHDSCGAPLNCGGYTQSAHQEVTCQPLGTPVLIDVLNNGYDLTDRKSGVFFDLLAINSPILVSWTAPNSDDSFLALDRNQNGKIDDGTELFGDRTPQSVSWSSNGFLALAEFDKPSQGGNGNGSIDPGDQVFSKLILWRDVDHDGASSASELFPLASAGITSIELNYKTARRVDEFNNIFRYRAKVHGKSSGHWAWDVYLVTG